MYNPKHFRMEDRSQIIEFMRAHSFATLVTIVDDRPFATHLPFVIAVDDTEIRLYAHVARANPQWRSFEVSEALVIFQGPHAYISPSLYDSPVNVPTWNYIAVHAGGPARILSDPSESDRALQSLIQSTEPAYVDQWNTLPVTYKSRMLNAIIAFEIQVERLEGKQKLSQNRSAAEQLRIITALEAEPEPAVSAVAHHMSTLQTSSSDQAT
jgi:transcriptional regulator